MATISKNFLSGGKAIFTVSNPKGVRYTYKVSRPKPETPFFVSLLTGPDNTADYTYIGVYTEKPEQTFRTTSKSKLPATSIPVTVFAWASKMVLTAQPLPNGYSIHHEGRCGRCGRSLTVPESIESGFGPECIEKI